MNLRQRLKRSGVTLKEVSSETGISESTICHVLNETLGSKIKYSAEKLIQERIAEFSASEAATIS
jgi:AraC-like DNA-binding protein